MNVRDAFLGAFTSTYKPEPGDYGKDRQVYVNEIAEGKLSNSSTGKKIDKGESQEIAGKDRQRIDKSIKGMNGQDVDDIADEERMANREEAQKSSVANKAASVAEGVASQTVSDGSTGILRSNKVSQPIMR